jgi:hypothetical protein
MMECLIFGRLDSCHGVIQAEGFDGRSLIKRQVHQLAEMVRERGSVPPSNLFRDAKSLSC